MRFVNCSVQVKACSSRQSDLTVAGHEGFQFRLHVMGLPRAASALLHCSLTQLTKSFCLPFISVGAPFGRHCYTTND